jgi:hypothetical protein
MKRLVIAVACAAILASCFILTSGGARADMLVMPMRVYFKDGDRLKGLTTLNTGNVQAVYRLSFEHKKQLPNGSYENLQGPLNPAYNPADWLVYSPRQVSLVPQAKQGIRISLRRPADLPDGEYRTHAILKRTARDAIESRGESAPQGSQASMMINVGFAIPVVIRKGRYDTTATIESFRMLAPDASDGGKSRAQIDILRQGKYSSVGRVDAYWRAPGAQEEVQVSGRSSLIIFPEVDRRTATLTFNRPVQGGTIRLVYRGIEADKDIVFDEKTFPVQ